MQTKITHNAAHSSSIIPNLGMDSSDLDINIMLDRSLKELGTHCFPFPRR
jgi:hypothetical protein